MAKKALVIQRFDGGLSTDLKIGPSHSFSYSRHFDFRKSPTQLTLLPGPSKESSTTVTGLITEMIMLPSGKIAAIDSSGGFYTRATNGTWTKNGTSLGNTACGMAYNEQFDCIFIPGTNNIHTVTNADGKFSGGSLTVNADQLTYNVDQSATNSTNTYTTTTSITETSANMLSFSPAAEPFIAIKIWVTTKGTGDLTVTLHDGANNLMGSKTVAVAGITNGALNEFLFATPVRMQVAPGGATYHVHITHDGGGTASTIGCATASDFSTARYESYANRLVATTNGFHPVKQFLQYLCIGNGRYLTVWEPITQNNPLNTEYLRHRLTFPSGYEVTSLDVYTEYLAIACEKRSSSAGTEYQDGKIFFWDGVSPTYNFFVNVPEGSPYSIASHRNILQYIAGGSRYAWSGGNPVKMNQMPNTDTEYGSANTYVINYPNMSAVRNGILLQGYPSETNSTTIEHGVYSYGSRDRGYRDSFGFSYTISTGHITNGTLRLGCVKSFGDKLFISWRDDTTYGVDIVNPASTPATTGVWESLLLDDGRPDKSKVANEMYIDFTALPADCTVTPKYKIDRGAWVTGTAAGENETQAKLNINKRYREIQIGMDVTAGATSPTIIGLTLIRDTNMEEAD